MNMHRIVGLMLFAALAMLVGCSENKIAAPNPIQQLQMLIANLPDSAKKPARFEALFVAGAAPPVAERAKYGKLMLHATKATQEGQTATVDVRVEDSNGAKLGEVQWTAVLEADGWKLQKVPLP